MDSDYPKIDVSGVELTSFQMIFEQFNESSPFLEFRREIGVSCETLSTAGIETSLLVDTTFMEYDSRFQKLPFGSLVCTSPPKFSSLIQLQDKLRVRDCYLVHFLLTTKSFSNSRNHEEGQRFLMK